MMDELVKRGTGVFNDRNGRRLARAALLIGWMFAHPFFVCTLYAAQETATAVVRFYPEHMAGRFEQTLFGHNIQWTSDGDGLLGKEKEQGVLDPNAVDAIRNIPVAVIRFPGGLLSSRYIWKDGIGPMQERREGLNYVGAPEPMRFGTDEFIRLLTDLKTSGMITVRSNGNAGDAADWLRHCGKANVLFWEFGNESFLPQDPSYMPVKEYVSRFKAFQKELKAVNPDIKTGALLEGSLIGAAWGKYVIPELDEWNETVIRETAGTADFYAAHLYAPFDSTADAGKTLTTLAAAPVAMSKNIGLLQKMIRRHGSSAGLWITEFNLGMKTPQDAWKYGTSLAQAGYIASMMLTFARNEVAGANYWSLIGNHNFGLLKDGETRTERPSALVYRLLAPLAGARLIRSEVLADAFKYQPIGNVEAGLDPRLLDAQAFLDNDLLHIVLVNRLPDKEVTVKLILPENYGLDLKNGGRITLQGPHALANNESSSSVALVNGQAEVNVSLSGGAISRVWARLSKK